MINFASTNIRPEWALVHVPWQIIKISLFEWGLESLFRLIFNIYMHACDYYTVVGFYSS